MPLYEKAYKYFSKGNIEKALEILNDNDLEKHNNADLWFFKAQLFEMKTDYDRAIECYAKAIEINPDYAEAYYNMGIAYDSKPQPDYAQAIKCYEKAIEINPDYAIAYNNMGIAYKNKPQPDYDKAIECYAKAIEINPDYANAYYNMGLAYRALGNDVKASECFQKASILNHNGSFTDGNF